MNIAGELKMNVKQIIFAGLASLALTACQGDKSTTLQDSLTGSNTTDTISNYDLAASIIPFPNDFLFAVASGQASDGTLNIPVVSPTNLADPKVAMNGVDGFSTDAPMTTGFSAPIDANSISAQSVRVYPVTKGVGPGGPATAVAAPLVYGVDYIAALSSVDPTASTLVILPLKPLAPKSSYAVVITNKLKSSSGKPVGISGSYALTRGAAVLYDLTVPPAVPPSSVAAIKAAIKAPVLLPAPGATDAEIIAAGQSAAKLETIRKNIVKPTEDAIVASDASLTSNDIILQWTFTTQSITDVLKATRTQDRTLTTTAGFSSSVTTLSPLGAADIHVGTMQVPYYLTAAANSSDPTPLGSFWHGVGGSLLSYLTAKVLPVATSTQTIPMLVSIPTSTACAAGMPNTGWPIVIFQHGITGNRTNMLAISDAMAGACLAVVAIDLPMHGVTGNETNGTAAFKNPAANGGERTFDLDLVTQDAAGNITAPVPDGIIDSSGSHFINLANLQNTRDNLRQGVSDLFVLVDDIEKGTITDGSNKMDPAKIYFLGHSLGAMVGTVFTALEPDVKAAAFAFGGASLPKILDGSATFEPTISAGLAANGVIKGTPDYESFMGAAQTVIDSGDPVNFASLVATAPPGGRGVLFFEIAGSNSSPSDLVVPNTVPDKNDTTGTVPAPLAGTEPQLKLMGLTQVNTTQGPGTANLEVVTKYVEGNHSSLLNPADTPASPLAPASVVGENAKVTKEIQTEIANFFGSDGHYLKVTDSSVLQTP